MIQNDFLLFKTKYEAELNPIISCSMSIVEVIGRCDTFG